MDNKYFYIGSSNFTVYDMNQEMGYFGPTKNSADFKKVFESDFHAALDSWQNEAYKARKNPEIQFKDDSVKLVGPGTQYPDLRSLLLQQIGAAQRQILISAYEATDTGILKTLIDKKRQFPEIDIRVVLCVGKLPVRLWGKNFEIPKSITSRSFATPSRSPEEEGSRRQRAHLLLVADALCGWDKGRGGLCVPEPEPEPERGKQNRK